MAVVAKNTTVGLHPLHIGPEEDGLHEVGRPETAVFIQLPAEGVAIIRWLGEGLPLDRVRERFAAEFGVEPELDEFVAGLIECDFVESLDGEPVATPDSAVVAQARPRGVRLFGSLPQRRVAWLLSKPLRIAYLAVWLAVPVLLVIRPDLIPRYSDALWHPSVMVNAFIITVLGWALIFVHEFAHILTAKARGCAGALSLSRRLYFLVAQTDMSGVRAVPRKERYAPYLAGMTFDVAALLVCTALRMAGVGGSLPGVIGYLVAVQILFQCAVCLRTDLYFVMTNWLRVGNLAEDTRRYLASRWQRLRRRPADDLADIPARELRIIRWYTPFYTLGIAVLMANLVVLVVPVVVSMTGSAIATLAAGGASRWDGLAFLAVITFNFGTLAFITYREYRQRRAGS